ncbi:MAG: hypothetical protein ABR947_03740, partial [Solirubrobacteraceae bacterium]
MRLRHVCTLGSALLALGAFAAEAAAEAPPSGTAVGGATAPVNIGPTGATGATGTTGTTGTAGAATPESALTAPLAPITLAKGQSPSLAYDGPVFVEAPTGELTPYIPQTQAADVSGGTVAGIPGLPHLVVPGATAEIVNGIAAAPEEAPLVVDRIIWAANQIIGRPYVYGGGHASFKSYGYDCSGTVSYALHGGA